MPAQRPASPGGRTQLRRRDTRKTAVTIPSQEAIERCATKFGVPVDA
jgi:hypothetical protein